MSASAMNGAHDPIRRSAEIRMLVADNQVADAIKKAMEFARDFSKRLDDLDESTVMSMEWRQIEDGYRRDALNFEQASAARKKLVRQLLALVRAVEETLSGELSNA
jgi:hypothetical protein